MKFKLHKDYPALIKSKYEMKQAIEDFGLNLCKAHPALKNDKEIVLQAVKKDPFSIVYVSKELKDDSKIKEEILKRQVYLSKYIDPVEAVIDFSKGEITEKDIKLIELRNSKAYERTQELAVRLNSTDLDFSR